MEYIKKYNINLYNHIKSLHHKEESNFFQKILEKIRTKFTKIKVKNFNLQHVEKIKRTGCEFMNISYETYNSNVEKALLNIDDGIEYTNQSETNIFWQNNIDNQWLCLNIEVQSVWYNFLYDALMRSNLVHSGMTVYDHGCGSGTFSLLLNEQFNFKKLTLCDLDNYTRKFITHYIQKYELQNVFWSDVLESPTDEVDLIICLDVLEHLENSYEQLVFLDSKLKSGGILFLKIAFECEDKTHLPQAAEDFFFTHDGLKFLREKYTEVLKIGHGQIVNGIFKKR